jgi:hypothetical protein
MNSTLNSQFNLGQFAGWEGGLAPIRHMVPHELNIEFTIQPGPILKVGTVGLPPSGTWYRMNSTLNSQFNLGQFAGWEGGLAPAQAACAIPGDEVITTPAVS